MPVPIIDRQRALSRVGEIRAGGEKNPNSPGRKLESFRLTSAHKEIIERAAGLYGGEPKPWASPTGDAWQLYTDASSLPVMLILGYSLRQTYELWEGATKFVRRCDGIHEDFTDGPCLCNQTGKDECSIMTRLMVVLPETGTSLGWQLISKGENAARELSGAMAIAENMAGARAFLPATLRLTQRRSVVGGQTKRYVVPVIDFNLAAEAARLQPSMAEQLGPGHTPIAEIPAAGVTVEEGLRLASQEPKTRNGRQAAPIPDIDDVPFGDAPVPVADEPAPPAAPDSPQKRTAAQAKKLNVLVGKLRDAGRITTEQLYAALARSRNIDGELMVEVLDGARDVDGVLHWGPLRDSLTKVEASDLIERLSRLEEHAAA